MPTDDFKQRLSAALGQARGTSPTVAPPAAASDLSAPPTDSDQFSNRLNSALQRARGEPDPAAAEAAAEPAQDEPLIDSAGPAGTGERVVREGECISSIAFDTGHHWETIWDDAGNAELRENRSSPNTLLQQDLVHVPDLRRKEDTGATEMRHRFRRLGMPEKFRLRLCTFNDPRANLSYTLIIDGVHYDGVTDGDGRIEQFIPPDARRGKLIISEDEQYDFQLGALDPVTEEAGMKARLVNLNYLESEDVDDEEEYRAALQEFQRKQELPATGEADEATQQKMMTVHGC